MSGCGSGFPVFKESKPDKKAKYIGVNVRFALSFLNLSFVMLWLFDLYSNYTADLQGPAKVALDVVALGLLATTASAVFKIVTESLDSAKSRSLPLPPGPPDGWFSPGPK